MSATPPLVGFSCEIGGIYWSGGSSPKSGLQSVILAHSDGAKGSPKSVASEGAFGTGIAWRVRTAQAVCGELGLAVIDFLESSVEAVGQNARATT